jgi:hypothetical protein
MVLETISLLCVAVLGIVCSRALHRWADRVTLVDRR